MSPLHGEYRVQAHPDHPDRILIRWRRDDSTCVWIHVAIVDHLSEVSDAMVEHRDGTTT